MAIDEKKILELIHDFSHIKQYFKYVEKILKSQAESQEKAFEAIKQKEYSIKETANKVFKISKSAANEIDLIKKQFLPMTMNLCQKIVDSNSKLKKRVDSLEHQVKKINK